MSDPLVLTLVEHGLGSFFCPVPCNIPPLPLMRAAVPFRFRFRFRVRGRVRTTFEGLRVRVTVRARVMVRDRV